MSRRASWFVSAVGFGAALLLVADGELPTAFGQPKPLVVPPTPQAPALATPASLGVKRGGAAELTLAGTNLTDPTAVLLSCPGTVTIPTDNKNGTDAAKFRVKVALPADAPVGLHTLRVATKQGVSNLRPFVVDDLPEVAESGSNRTKETAQAVTAPCAVTGAVAAEGSGYFKLTVAAGQRLTFEVLARRIGSPLDPIVVLHDGKTRRELVDLYADDTPGLQGDCRLTHTFKDAGEVLVEVRDTTYRGGGDFAYRLRIGDFPGATVAFPLAVQRGQSASVGFAGPGVEDVPPVAVKAPADPGVPTAYAAPKRATGVSGWPVPVRLTDEPQLVEQEPNDDPKAATKVPVPGGVSARFGAKGDVDHFGVAAKKGQKLAVTALTYEANLPTEVLIRVLDAKGAEVARSNPAQPAARAEFTPPADGDFVIACEHLNYLYGPNEVYHLTVAPVGPDFAVALAADRCETQPGGTTALAVTTITRLNGFAGPLDLEVVGDPNVTGKLTVPAAVAQTYLPITVKAGTKPGAYPVRVRARATIDGQEVVRVATFTDVAKAALGGMPNPPAEALSGAVVGVVEKPAVAVKLTADPAAVAKGQPAKLVAEVTRGDGADAEVAVAALFLPPNVTAAAKPVPKGQAKAEVPLTVPAAAATGPTPVVLRLTTKAGGKDHAVIAAVVLDVTEPKKGPDPKKDEPKKDKK